VNGFLHELDGLYRRTIPEVKVHGKPLGRHVFYDPQSRRFPADLAPAVKNASHAFAVDALPIDQLQVGSCTGEAAIAVLDSVPHWAPGQPTLGQSDAYNAYSLEQQLMGYGPFPPADNGGSGPEVCQALKKAGVIYQYQHATTLEEALLALVPRPVMTGVNWYTSFDEPSSAGLIEIAPGATVRGGHEFMVFQILLRERLVGCLQSWGPTFGVGIPSLGIRGGVFYMSFDTWNTLLSQQGDVTIPRTCFGWRASPISA
jgi:hypothetical protein